MVILALAGHETSAADLRGLGTSITTVKACHTWHAILRHVEKDVDVG